MWNTLYWSPGAHLDYLVPLTKQYSQAVAASLRSDEPRLAGLAGL